MKATSIVTNGVSVSPSILTSISKILRRTKECHFRDVWVRQFGDHSKERFSDIQGRTRPRIFRHSRSGVRDPFFFHVEGVVGQTCRLRTQFRTYERPSVPVSHSKMTFLHCSCGISKRDTIN